MALRLAQNPLVWSRPTQTIALRAPLQAAGFQTSRAVLIRASQKLQIGGGGSGDTFIKGTVNDATTFPPPSRTAGSYHWDFERIVSVALVPLFASSAVQGAHPITDGLLAGLLVIHSQLGFDQILTDYLHKRKFPIVGPIAKWGVRSATVLALVGLYQFNTNDIGITELMIRIWHA